MVMNIAFNHDISRLGAVSTPRFSCVMVKLVCKNRFKSGSFKPDIQTSSTGKQADSSHLFHGRNAPNNFISWNYRLSMDVMAIV